MNLQDAIKAVKEEYKPRERHIEEKQVIDEFGNMFQPNCLDKLNKEDFKSFLLYKKNKHWWGIARHGNEVTKDMGKLRLSLKILLDENKPLKKRLDSLFQKNSPYYIHGLGKAVVTPILMVVYPMKYGVYNNRTAEGLKKVGLYPKVYSFSDRYIKINEILNDLAIKNSMSLFELDVVWWKITKSL
jgi:hypothetical protein